MILQIKNSYFSKFIYNILYIHRSVLVYIMFVFRCASVLHKWMRFVELYGAFYFWAMNKTLDWPCSLLILLSYNLLSYRLKHIKMHFCNSPIYLNRSPVGPAQKQTNVSGNILYTYFCNSKVAYCVHKNLPLVRILSRCIQFMPYHIIYLRSIVIVAYF